MRKSARVLKGGEPRFRVRRARLARVKENFCSISRRGMVRGLAGREGGLCWGEYCVFDENCLGVACVVEWELLLRIMEAPNRMGRMMRDHRISRPTGKSTNSYSKQNECAKGELLLLRHARCRILCVTQT